MSSSHLHTKFCSYPFCFKNSWVWNLIWVSYREMSISSMTFHNYPSNPWHIPRLSIKSINHDRQIWNVYENLSWTLWSDSKEKDLGCQHVSNSIHLLRKTKSYCSRYIHGYGPGQFTYSESIFIHELHFHLGIILDLSINPVNQKKNSSTIKYLIHNILIYPYDYIMMSLMICSYDPIVDACPYCLIYDTL